MSDGTVLVLGLGEVGKPLLEILAGSYLCKGIDLQPEELSGPCPVMHVCYPYHISDFVAATVRYMRKYQPALTIINSTVAPGTTRQVHEASGGMPVAYSAVRGKHARMLADMRKYKKFVAGCTEQSTAAAAQHFRGAGLNTDTFRTPEIGELAKLLETTYLGVLIGWTQEMERLGLEMGASFEELNAFITEIDFLPSSTFPGVIGGHCVMPNIAILRQHFHSPVIEAIYQANEEKKKRALAVTAGGAQ